MREKAIFFFSIFFFLFCVGVQAQKEETKLRVVADQANIRLKPDISSIIIKQVPKGTILPSIGKEGEWYKVQIKEEGAESVPGYVHESLVLVLSPPSTEEAETEEAELEEKEKKEEEQVRTIPPLTTPPSPKPSRAPFSLSFSGGGIIVSGGDLNTGAQGLADFYEDSLNIEGEGEVKPVRLGYIFGGELYFPLTPILFLGFGVDYFLREKESHVEFLNASFSAYITRPKIQSIPLRLFLSVHPSPSFYIKAGVEYHLAQADYFYRFETEESWEEWQGESKAQGIGFMGGFGFEWKLSASFSLILEATGRYAPITGFEGKNTYRDSNDDVSIEEGKLYFYYGSISGEKTYPLLFIRESAPSDPRVSDPKEANVDLSGLSLKVGFKIGF